MQIVNDISFWQKDADFGVMRLKSDGVILRAGQGSWRDTKYSTFKADAKAAGMPYGNYFYYDNRYEPKRQAENWARIIDGDEGSLGSWLDLEDSNYGAFSGYKNWWDCAAYFKQIKPDAVLGIYTRASYFNDPTFSVPVNHAFRNLPLWVAQYKTNKPDLPKGWTDWLMWQFTDEGDGYAHGVGSKEIDMNYRKGEVVTPARIEAKFENQTVLYEAQ